MPFVGPFGALATAFLAAVIADLKGNRATRGFTRFGFGVVAFRSMGGTLTGFQSFLGDVWGLLPL